MNVYLAKRETELLRFTTACETASNGGRWLGVAREWIQGAALNGDMVKWGSQDTLRMRWCLTVSEVERLTSDVAAAAINEQRELFRSVLNAKEAQYKRIIQRMKCGCLSLDCRKHGSYDPHDVDLALSIFGEG